MSKHDPASLEPDFEGRIADTAADSMPWWPRETVRTSPNVVVILLDDVGFAQFGCYGSSISTPNVDALASRGVRYSNFHVPALCSPTRASLLTGRNHHSVGMGFLGAFDTGFPGYRGRISPAAATLPEMLAGNGYASYAVGKWHLTPPAHMTPAGPFDQWPTQRGFDRYYGFLWGEDDQWTPELWYDQHRVEVPQDDGYHFSEDMVGRAREFVSDHLTSRPGNPFFCYMAFGACHAPHQAPREYIDRYAGRFDHGWDAERERVLRRQIELGLVPPDTRLSDRNPGVPSWESLSGQEQRLFARMQEAFAGFMEHTDEQIGRFVTFLAAQGALENTVVLVLSDNGASGEGGRNGTVNEYRYFLGLEDSIDDALGQIDEIGGRSTHNQYPAGWAQAGNTPARFYKKHAYGGGVRAPLIVHWPAGLGEPGGIRTQFHHVIDLAPTILDITQTTAPTSHRGIEQMPLHGTSLRYSFTDAAAPTTHPTQYFETAGFRGIYHDGWKAIAVHEPGDSFADDRWELYDLGDDFSETHDLSEAHPDLASRLEELWHDQARRYGVYPLDDRMSDRVTGLDPAADKLRYRMLPGTRLLNHLVGPSFSERSFTVSARVGEHARASGVLLAYGRRAFGFSFFVKDGRLMADYNLAGRHTLLKSEEVLTDDQAFLQFTVSGDGERIIARLAADGEILTEAVLPRLLPGGIGTLSIQCGHNSPSAVSAEYEAPFPFAGDLEWVDIELEPRRTTGERDRWNAEMASQ